MTGAIVLPGMVPSNVAWEIQGCELTSKNRFKVKIVRIWKKLVLEIIFVNKTELEANGGVS